MFAPNSGILDFFHKTRYYNTVRTYRNTARGAIMPKIIAHRGVVRKAPQNTLPAFESAAALGADGVETDVRMTRDGKVVICHNIRINAISDGKGSVHKLTLGEINRHDFGSYYSDAFRGTKMLTLEEFFSYVSRESFNVINVEIKPQNFRNSPIALKTLRLAEKYGLADRLIISSFSPKILRQVKHIDPTCRTALIYPAIGHYVHRRLISPVRIAKKYGIDALNPEWDYVGRSLVKRAHKLGIEVNPWGANSVNKLKKMISLGVDGLITDAVTEAKELMR